MTPERKAWLDSLPREEKIIRESLKNRKLSLKGCKRQLGLRICRAHYKNRIKQEKILLKALRKQIAMRPANAVSGICGDCPACRGFVIRRENDFCPECGQKIRW